MLFQTELFNTNNHPIFKLGETHYHIHQSHCHHQQAPHCQAVKWIETATNCLFISQPMSTVCIIDLCTCLHSQSHHAFTNGYSCPPGFLNFRLSLDSEDGFRTGFRTWVTNNSPSQESYQPDDLFQSRYESLYLSQWSSHCIISLKTNNFGQVILYHNNVFALNAIETIMYKQNLNYGRKMVKFFNQD